MDRGAERAIKKAEEMLRKFGTRNPYRLANELGIILMERNFQSQKGVYKVIERNRFIFIKKDLHPVMKSIVLLHEIGHDLLHRKEAIRVGGFHEFNIYNMGESRMEYEANMFAAQISLVEEELLEYIGRGYDVQQIAMEMNSDINLVALKVSELNGKGYNFNKQEHRKEFLK